MRDARDIRRGLQHIELRPEPGAEIAARDLERLARVLHILRLGFENAIRLLRDRRTRSALPIPP